TRQRRQQGLHIVPLGAGGVDNFDGDGGLRENRRFGTAPGSNSGSGTKETSAVEMSAGHAAILSG
ncbi:MAG: hypothetical protein EBY17_15185, partial [Acidobacteriia bacterium]|nr:hypothetical protein [Terriglobia bacterium]